MADQRLVQHLVGSHYRLYHDSAYFHAQIEMVANALPIIIDALAVSAEEEDKASRERLRMMEMTPGPGPWLIDAKDSARWLGLPFPTTLDG